MRGGRFWIALFVVSLLVVPEFGCAAIRAKGDRGRRAGMLEAGRTGLCRVHYYFKRPPDEPPVTFDPWSGMQELTRFQYDSFIDKQMSLVAVGLLLDDAGRVLVSDMHFEDKYIDRIEVVGPDGTKYPAEREKLLDRAPAEILRITEPLKDWTAPRFVMQEQITQPESAYVVTLSQTGQEWWLSIQPVGDSYMYEGSGSAPERFSSEMGMGVLEAMMPGGSYDPLFMFGTAMSAAMAASGAPALLCNDKGQPIGAAVAGWPLEPDQKTADWQHERLLDGPAIAFSELEELVENCRQEFGKKICKCRIVYRQEAEERRSLDFMLMIQRSMRAMTGEDEKEWTTYGLAVAPDRLLVPYPIGRDQAAKIEKIEVTVEDQVCEGEFIGAFQDVGAFLVDLKEGTLPAFSDMTEQERPDRMRLFLTVAAEQKFGKKHLRVRPNRWFQETRGYKDRYYISPVHSLPQGTWILDRDFDFVGLHAGQRMEGEELHGLSSGIQSLMMGELTGGTARIFWTPEISAMLSDPVAHFDRQVRFKTKEEAKRIVWLGVEFNPLTRELAKQLDVEKESKDGKVGLHVNRVYKESPAQRMGINVGDILLRIETRKRPHPIDLSPSEDPFGFLSFDWDGSDYMDYQYVEEYGETEPKWPLRLNYLTMLLQTIGEGEKATLTYLHDGHELTEEFIIAGAPRDFISARKYKNKKIGLTVKDLTYEVRASLRLADEKKAVVVSKIEPGSPAEVANVRPFELITAIDGVSVGSAEEFEERVKQGLEAKKERLRLTVEYLGKSRLADLDLSQAKAGEEQ